MWFRYPTGATRITVERQEFGIDYTDAEGNNYFRAPNHFAAIILMGPGYKQAAPPEGAPEDLPQPDPLRDGAISRLTAELETSRTLIAGLREELTVMQAALSAMTLERNNMKKLLDLAQADKTTADDDDDDEVTGE